MSPQYVENIIKYIKLNYIFRSDLFCPQGITYFVPPNTHWQNTVFPRYAGSSRGTVIYHPADEKEIQKIIDKHKKIQECDLYKVLTGDKNE